MSKGFQTDYELGAQIARILGAMPPPRNMDGEMLSNGYFDGLRQFPIAAVTEAIDGFLGGRWGEHRWCPTPPQLATYVRECLGHRPDTGGRKFAFKAPASMRLEQGITRDEARRLVQQGLYPRGSIWFPGEAGEKAAFGDLYAPDNAWADPTPIRQEQDTESPRNIRMTEDERRYCVEIMKDEFRRVSAHERAGFFGRDHSQAIGLWLDECRGGRRAV